MRLNKNLKKNLILLFKILFVFSLFYFLAQKGLISLQATQNALKQWKIIVPAVAVLLFTSLLGVIRWQWLLQAQGICLPWTRTFQLTFIGNFFNIALPGAVSGDIVKAIYIGQEMPGKRSGAFGSILFDRLAGVAALVLVSAATLLLGFRTYEHSPMLQAIQIVLIPAALGVILFFVYLFCVKEHHDPLLKLFQTIEKTWSKAGIFTRLYSSLRHYHHCRGTVIKVMILSAGVHLAVGWSCFHFAQALGETQILLQSLWIVVPLGLLVTAIPVAPAGVGIGNVAFFYFFHLIGSERGADVFILYALTSI